MVARINVALNRTIRRGNGRKKVEHLNVKMTFNGDPGEPGFTDEVLHWIGRAYPGWNLTGYSAQEAKS